jgi:hypothetical protein
MPHCCCLLHFDDEIHKLWWGLALSDRQNIPIKLKSSNTSPTKNRGWTRVLQQFGTVCIKHVCCCLLHFDDEIHKLWWGLALSDLMFHRFWIFSSDLLFWYWSLSHIFSLCYRDVSERTNTDLLLFLIYSTPSRQNIPIKLKSSNTSPTKNRGWTRVLQQFGNDKSTTVEIKKRKKDNTYKNRRLHQVNR